MTGTPLVGPRRTTWQRVRYLLRRAWWMELWGYVSIFRFVFQRPRVPAGSTAFTYSQPVLFGITAFIVVSAIEMVVIDVLVRRWETVRISLLALSAWGLVWMFGLLFGLLTRPHAVGPDGLRLRSGAEVELVLPWSSIASVRRHKQGGAEKQPQLTVAEDGSTTLHLHTQNETNVQVRLRQPVAVRLPRGRYDVSRVELFLDDPAGFVAEAQRCQAAFGSGSGQRVAAPGDAQG